MKRIDLSHPIVPGMQTYPVLPVPEAHVFLDYEASRPRYRDQAEFFIASLHLCGNTGRSSSPPTSTAVWPSGGACRRGP